MAKRRHINDKIDVFDVIITDDKNFSNDNYSKGVNRRVVPITINREQGKMVVVKGHSLGKNKVQKSARKIKKKKGYYDVFSDGKEQFYLENMPITEYSNGDIISDKYDLNRNMFPSDRKIIPGDRERLYKHITKNKKQSRQSAKNKTTLKKFRSNKRKKRGK